MIYAEYSIKLVWRVVASLDGAEQIHQDMSTGMSRWMWTRVSPVNRSIIIEDRRGDLIVLSPLKDLSAEQLVTGKVHMMAISTLMLGYIDAEWKSHTHFYSLWIAAATSTANSAARFQHGKSSLYILASCILLMVYSPAGRDTRTDGIMARPNNAVRWWELIRVSISESRWSNNMQRQ